MFLLISNLDNKILTKNQSETKNVNTAQKHIIYVKEKHSSLKN